MKKVLLIGGTGVLSSAVTNEAIKQNIEVTMINRGHNKKRIPSEAKLIIADKNNVPYIRKRLEDLHFDAIIDFLCFNEQELINSFNLYSSFTNQYFLISTAGVYNNSIPGPCKEDHQKVQPLWDYSINKWKSEERLAELASKVPTHYTIIRPMVTYDDTRIPYGIAPYYGYHWTLVERIKHNKPIIIWNGGNNRCTMMRVEDFAVGLVGLIGNPKAYNQAFNICGDESPSFKEVLDILGELLSHQVSTIDIDPHFYAEKNPTRAGELLGGRAITTIIDNSKLKEAVPSFEQRIKLKEGLQMTLDAYLQNNYQKGIDWEFEALTDKTISKWCKENHINQKDYNLSFINYLGTATWKDRLKYNLVKHSDCVMIKMWQRFDLWMRREAYSLLKSKKVK